MPPKKLPMIQEVKCPYTEKTVEAAFRQEVHLFMHAHMRGYDRTGEGIAMDSTYFDKYGAPFNIEESWIEGYHAIERELAKHFNRCMNPENAFPECAGMAGGGHLYKDVGHANEPWNWTGWVPRFNRWLCENKFYRNRHFLTLRGNEIQNNLWDYHPYAEAEGRDTDDDEYEQMTPVDSFEGKGYWFPGNAWGRYIHIMALKSHLHESDGTCSRYNFIVHPLAYRASIKTTPDNTVDGTQWTCLNVNNAALNPHFTKDKWGDKCHGIEIFNDFTYYYSWQPQHDQIPIYNSTIMNYGKSDDYVKYAYWFNTYPMEFGEFLVDTCLTRGCYLQIISANDAFYNRGFVPDPKTEEEKKDQDRQLEAEKKARELRADPKASLVRTDIHPTPQPLTESSTRLQKKKDKGRTNKKAQESADWMMQRPYTCSTVFGYTSLLDPRFRLRGLYKTAKTDKAECLILDWLQKGFHFAHTGVYDIFNFGRDEGDEKIVGQSIPISIYNQRMEDEMCYDITDDMQLKFTFPKVTKRNLRLIWRYALESEQSDGTILSVHGYFKLSDDRPTQLNLDSCNMYPISKLKWIRFQAFNDENPQRRAWFQPIRGPAFGDPKPDVVPPKRVHKIFMTKEYKNNTAYGPMGIVEQADEFIPQEVDSNNLHFILHQCDSREEENTMVYHLQASSLQPRENQDTRNSHRGPDGRFLFPERYVQNITGYFELNQRYPTKLNLSHSWDPNTVVDFKVQFYALDDDSGQPCKMGDEPNPYPPPGWEI